MKKFAKLFILFIISITLIIMPTIKGNASSSSSVIYTDSNYNFAISHPSQLQAKENWADLLVRRNAMFVKNIEFTDKAGQLVYSIGVYDNQTGMSLKEWIDRYNPNENDSGMPISVGSFNGMLYRINAAGFNSPTFYFLQGKEVYVLTGAKYNQEFLDYVSSYRCIDYFTQLLNELFSRNHAYAYGPFVLPFYNNYNVTCGFGCYAGHTGTDYPLPNRTSVAAASGGDLRHYVQQGIGYGNYIVIKHTNGYRTRYAHLDSFIKPDGATVSQGDTIALSGNSGGPWCQETDVQGNCIRWDSPYHLHFETRINAGDGDYLAGTAVDPYSSSNYLWTTNPPSLATPYKTTTIGQFDPNQAIWYLRYTNTTGSADNTFAYGNSNWTPITGDWNNDKITTIGLVNPNNMTFYLRNENSTGGANITFQYGNIGWIPITGDWDGNGTTTIGLVDPSTMTFYLRNQNSAGGADITFQYGNIGWTPITGDWDKNGTTTIGLFDPNQAYWYLRNENSTGGANITFQYGNSGWISVTGDWNADGYTTIGLFDSSTGIWYLRNTNDAGAAHLTFSYGNSGWKPVTGAWQ